MITVEEALSRILELCPKTPKEYVPIRDAFGRVLCETVLAKRDQPPFDASAMDGYAVRRADMQIGASLHVIGEAAAGRVFDGKVTSGTAVRIFTGGVVPKGADMILIQENVTQDGAYIHINLHPDDNNFIRNLGSDFAIGDKVNAPRKLNAADIGLLASMNIDMVPVAKKPVVAVIATGDELVQPGGHPNTAQIIASNNYAVKAVLESQGATVRLLPIARDNPRSLKQVFALAQGADMVVTIGGASVGDYDFINPMAAELGLALDFYKVAMRPGKPLIAGKLGDAVMVGLPGNPVSSLVCAQVFLRPAIDVMLGLPAGPLPRQTVELIESVGKNGSREHYMRADVQMGKCRVSHNQDSGAMSVVAQSNALLIRPANAPALPKGSIAECIML